ncbi:hypothetical protein HDV05_003967 [Chytridiales sp. JEL 0842]|nr:hypothetical protein HDV05_003967 [Chytridiales sp. JEL 0842]
MTPKQLKTFTKEEVATHNKEDDCWIIVAGKVYDISAFIDGHPGGQRVLMSVAGQDATKQFFQFHRPDVVFAKYDPKLLIGTIKDADIQAPEYNIDGPFGDLVAFGDPAWYQDWSSPFYKPSHRKLRAWMRQLVDTEITPFVHDWETAGSIPLSLLPKLGSRGVLTAFTGAYPWPKEAPMPPPGGVPPQEWDAFHELIMQDELGRCGSAGTVAALTVGSSIALPPIIKFGSQYLKEKVLADCMLGKKTICLAITEPYAGSDVAGLQATAVESADGKHYIINGEKKWITNGMWADFFVVAARTGGKGMTGITLFLVERSGGGVSTRKLLTQGGTGSGTSFVTLENVKVPKENIIGKLNAGFKAMMFNFNHERLGLAMGALRSARVCYEEAMKYSNKRRTFGQLLFEHGVIRNKLAHMARQIEATQAWTEFLCFQLTQMPPEQANIVLGGPIALLKAQATETLDFCAREASQILGGIAYTKGGLGEKVERIYRDVRAFAIPGGSLEIMLDLGIRQAQKVSQMMGAKL